MLDNVIVWCTPLVIGLVGLAWFLGAIYGAELHARNIKPLLEKLRQEIKSERADALVKGEQIGFAKGLEAGRSEEKDSLRGEFIEFLEEQLKLLKNQLPPPKPTPPKTVETMHGKIIPDEDGFTEVYTYDDAD
jgi:hypothetical protein